MSDRFRRDPVERNEDRQALARRANRPSVLVHWDVSPGRQRLVCLLRLGRQNQDVVNIQLDLIRSADHRHGLGHVFVRRTQPQAMLSQGCQMISAGYQDSLASDER